MRLRLVAALLVGAAPTALAAPTAVRSDRFTATLDAGLSSLRDQAGHVLVAEGGDRQGVAIRRVERDHWAGAGEGPDSLEPGGRAVRRYTDLADLPGATVECGLEVEEPTGDLIVNQRAEAPQKGVWGVEWRLGNIPLDLNILVPGLSGLKLTKAFTQPEMTFDYPIAWESQLVVVEGPGYGFSVWAEDAEGRFKRLTVRRTEGGWQLGFTTINSAPFDDLTSCESVRWHVNVYEGDWRVPARRYRDWAEQAFRPTRVEAQQPVWVQDIRCCVIMGLDIPVIEALAARLDPRQTLLYLPGWRQAGYDRDYPTYDQPVPELAPFVRRAKELGYRVMLHVNYFGVDPLNPLYAQFEPYQVRDPWGTHQQQWWLWERADPIIKFAYINPAHRPWRELFVERMRRLCAAVPVDALHLDQTLCIFNDHNGLLDGMSMLQGNVALHRELREALPEVALSGEGLDEVTCRYEAFAQRHAWGLNHTDGTWNRTCLQMAHPISSYLLRPYTVIYGYLGYAPPTDAQLYAAWNEAYQHWGVIPTLRPDPSQVAAPTGFSRQFFDEARCFQQERLDPDLDGPWPAGVCFPFRAADGPRAVRTAERVLLSGDREISRTITGVSEVGLPGSIPGWRVYDAERLFGLDPAYWYPYVPEPRDLRAFHVERLAEGFRASMVVQRQGLAAIATEQTGGLVADLAAELVNATCRSVPFEGEATEVKGPLSAPDGAQFVAAEGALFAHPPWQAPRRNPQTGAVERNGTGMAYVRFALRLPGQGELRFVSNVAIDAGAVGQRDADGVTFGVVVHAGGEELRAEVNEARGIRQPLTLDLTPFAGREVALELSVDPGPNRNPSFDWARWYGPRVEQDITTAGEMVVVSPEPYAVAFQGTEETALRPAGERYALEVTYPGTVFLVGEAPPPATLPLEVATAPFLTTFVSDTGEVLEAPQYASALPAVSTVGGIAKAGLFCHPPDHGRTVVDLPLRLPETPAQFHAFVGLRDESKSEGVVFRVEANGTVLAEEQVVPGQWHELAADLAPWAGKAVVLSLITDSDGPFSFDWAQWGTPEVRPG